MKQISALILSESEYTGTLPVPVDFSQDKSRQASARFDYVLGHIFDAEGGFSDHPRDNGKATKYGITTATLAEYRGQMVTKEDVRSLGKAEAREIYLAKYWLPCECDVLPAPFDLLVFNLAVNAGNYRSQDLFQDALNALGFDVKNDGDIGPQTFSAMQRANPHALVMAFRDRAERFYRSLSDFDVFGNGWLNRLAKFTKLALSEVPMTAVENWPATDPNPPSSPASAPKGEKTVADKALGGDALLGYKTYLAIAAYGVVEAAEAAGYIPTGVADIITPIIVSFGGVSFVSKVERYLRPVLTTIFGKK